MLHLLTMCRYQGREIARIIIMLENKLIVVIREEKQLDVVIREKNLLDVVIREKNLLGVVIRDTCFFDWLEMIVFDPRIFLRHYQITMNRQIQIEFETIFKFDNRTLAYFSDNKREKTFFRKTIAFQHKLCWNVVIREKNQLAVVIMELVPNNDVDSSLSYTGDFIMKTSQKNDRKYTI